MAYGRSKMLLNGEVIASPTSPLRNLRDPRDDSRLAATAAMNLS